MHKYQLDTLFMAQAKVETTERHKHVRRAHTCYGYMDMVKTGSEGDHRVNLKVDQMTIKWDKKKIRRKLRKESL